MPLLGFVISACNAEAYPPRCLDAVLGARRDDIETIVMDDCSADASAEIGKRHAEAHQCLRFYARERNAGHGPARSRGLDDFGAKYPAALSHPAWIDKRQRI